MNSTFPKRRMSLPNNISSWLILAVILLFLADVYFSVSMYTSIPSSYFDKVVYGIVSLVFAAVIVLLSFLIPNLFNSGTLGGIIGCLLAVVALVYLEIMSLSSSFGNTATLVQAREQQIINDSEEKLAANARLEAGQIKLDSLAKYGDPNKAAAMEREIAELEASLPLAPIMPADMAQYMNEDCSPKKDRRGAPYSTLAKRNCPEWKAMNAEYNAAVALISSKLAAARKYVNGHSEYLSQTGHVATLKTEAASVGKNANTSSVSGDLPMYVGLSKVDMAVAAYGTNDPQSMKNIFISRFTILLSLLQPLLVMLSQMLKGPTVIEAEYHKLEDEMKQAELDKAKAEQRRRIENMMKSEDVEQEQRISAKTLPNSFQPYSLSLPTMGGQSANFPDSHQ